MSNQLINNVQGNKMEKDFACRDNGNEVGPAVENRLMSEACSDSVIPLHNIIVWSKFPFGSIQDWKTCWRLDFLVKLHLIYCPIDHYYLKWLHNSH